MIRSLHTDTRLAEDTGLHNSGLGADISKNILQDISEMCAGATTLQGQPQVIHSQVPVQIPAGVPGNLRYVIRKGATIYHREQSSKQ